ncbi:putative ALA-interacting subunit 2 [Asimina triloba]
MDADRGSTSRAGEGSQYASRNLRRRSKGKKADVVEIVDRYDDECVPQAFRSDKVAYIEDSLISKNCTRMLQNHRRYVKSKSDRQLLYGLKYNDTSSCKPKESSNDLPIVPCGLIAWSLFNDTYTFSRERAELEINRKNIAWKSDREHKYGKEAYPFNFQNDTLIGGGKLDPNVPLSEQEDLIVWMRTSALPSFRKLYGRIEVDLEPEEFIAVKIVNNYNTYSFGGKKKIVISTSGWLGGKNDFLGIAYIAVGSMSVVMAIVFLLLHMKMPSWLKQGVMSLKLTLLFAFRPYGDTVYLSWNRKGNTM